jgi:hypothetical protein
MTNGDWSSDVCSFDLFVFDGTSFGSPGTGTTGLKTKGKSGTHVVNPGWKTKDNSSSGSVIRTNATSTITSQALSSNSDSVSSDAVRDQVRNFWSTKFSTSKKRNCDDLKSNHESKKKLVKPKVFKVDDDNEVDDCQNLGKCPVCNKHIPLNQINAHIDDCLNAPNQEAASSSTKLCSESKKRRNPFVFDRVQRRGFFFSCFPNTIL